MNCVVGTMDCTDQELRVQQELALMLDVLDRDRVHMMYDDPIIDLSIGHCKVAAVIPENHVVSNLLPSLRSIEYLIEIAVESECVFSD